MNRFLTQFWPALFAGLVVLAATIAIQVIQSKDTSKSGEMKAEFIYLPVSPIEVAKGVPSRRAVGVINIYNTSSNTLSDFKIFVAGFDGGANELLRMSPTYRRVQTEKPIDKEDVDSDGILRINVSKFAPDGRLSLSLESIFTYNLSIESSEPRIVIDNTDLSLPKSFVQNPTDYFSFITIALSTLAGFFVFSASTLQKFNGVGKQEDD